MISRFSGVRLLGMVLSLQAARDTFTRPYFASVYCGVNIGSFNPSRTALLCSREGGLLLIVVLGFFCVFLMIWASWFRTSNDLDFYY